MSFANFVANLSLNIKNFAQNLDAASKMMGKFASNAAKGSTKADKTFARYGQNIADATDKLTKHNFGLKDTARIVQGILVSQAFYTIAGAIKSATQELLRFNESLDYATVTYSALFGSQQLGEEFLATLREHAEETIFSYDQLAASAKKLLAYNIPYESIMYIMEGLTNLGAMSGDPAALDRIALALGQIYTRGKLGAEEMRQLANAYVPIYEIIQSKFGLTDDEMGRIGDLNLPAAEVINAVIDWANDEFGAVGNAAMLTITGLKQKISDAFMNLGIDILKPVTTFYKSLLVAINTGMDAVRAAYDAGGIGGIFEHFVPDRDMQTRIRQFFANVQALFKTFVTFIHSIGQVLKSLGTSFLNVFNVLAPVVNSIANILAGMIQIVTNNATAMRVLSAALAACAVMWVLFKAKAIGAMVVVALSKAIYGVASAVLLLSRLLAASPIITGLVLIAAGIAGIAAVSNKANNAISNLFNKLTAFNGGGGGVGRDGVLQLQSQLTGATGAADKFNNRLTDINDSIDSTGDAADAAGKKAKKAAAGLLSFDEVFKLNEPADTSSGAASVDDFDLAGILDGMGSIGDGLAEAFMPEIPDFSKYALNFVNSLKDSLLAKLGLAGLGALLASKILKHIMNFTGPIAAGAGASAGGIASVLSKALMGAFIGFGFDAIASLITDKLWAALEDALNLKDGSAEQASFGATLASIIGGAIGMAVGGLPGSLIGAAIGHLAGGVVGLFWQSIDGAFNNTAIGAGTGILTAIAKAFGGTIKQLPSLLSAGSFSGFFSNLGQLFTATGVKALAKGGVIGAAIGFVVDAIASMLWDNLAESLNLSAKATGNAKVGQTIGSVIGTIIGGLLGGPVGAIIGSAIGTFAGGFVGLFWEKIIEFFKPSVKTGQAVANSVTPVFSGAMSTMQSAVRSWSDETTTIFTEWFTNTKNGFVDWYNTSVDRLTNWWRNTTSGFSDWWSATWSGFNTWLDDTFNIFSDWDSITGDTLGEWWSDTLARFSGWWSETTSGFSTWWSDTTSGFQSWKDDTFGRLNAWANDTNATFSSWWSSTTQRFNKWKDEALKPIREWVTSVITSITSWVLDTKKRIDNWVSGVVQSFNNFKDKAISVIGGFAIAAIKAITDWCTKTKNNIYNWFTNLLKNIADWWNNIWKPKNWKSGWDSVKEWFSGLFGGISDWFNNLKSSVSNWWNNLWSGKKASVDISTNTSGSNFSMLGHATGGIFTKEHIARFAEGNKAEAVIPLENASAMQPFVDAVARGIIEGLAPTLMHTGGNNELPPMYVGTLVADDRGLKELYKRFEVIQVQENARRGVANAMA